VLGSVFGTCFVSVMMFLIGRWAKAGLLPCVRAAYRRISWMVWMPGAGSMEKREGIRGDQSGSSSVIQEREDG
jgi:hypothetical protein